MDQFSELVFRNGCIVSELGIGFLYVSDIKEQECDEDEMAFRMRNACGNAWSVFVIGTCF